MRRRRGLSEAPDAELLARTRHEPEAFGVFYDRYERPLLAFLLRATRRPDLAADLTAEVFAQALRSAPSYCDDLGPAQGWLFGIARHELADAWRRRHVDDVARRALAMEPLVLTDADLERVEQLDGVALALLDGLPADQRAAVRGRVLEERPYDELAAELACSESVVRQRVSRGLRRLRTRLEEPR